MIVNSRIEEYINNSTSEEDPLLKELNRETYLKVLNPRMLSGHPQGRVLEMISKLVSPKTILEIGTFTGYSGICLAKGLKPGGHLHTIERNDEIISYPIKYFKKAGITEQVSVHVGDALEIIPRIDEKFDLVFIDGDKKQYLDYYRLCIDKLNDGGVILADNVLWDGKVVSALAKSDPDTQSIIEFNKYIKEDDRVEVIILPVRDGISVIRKH